MPPEKLQKTTIVIIAFFFGLGVLVTAVTAGLLIVPTYHALLANARLVVKAGTILGVLVVVQILGKPIRILLSR